MFTDRQQVERELWKQTAGFESWFYHLQLSDIGWSEFLSFSVINGKPEFLALCQSVILKIKSHNLSTALTLAVITSI